MKIATLNIDWCKKNREIKQRIEDHIGIKSRDKLTETFSSLNLEIPTAKITGNTDHIVTSKSIKEKYEVIERVFIENNVVSDHMGVMIEIKKKV